jgi:hypothetical protein
VKEELFRLGAMAIERLDAICDDGSPDVLLGNLLILALKHDFIKPLSLPKAFGSFAERSTLRTTGRWTQEIKSK